MKLSNTLFQLIKNNLFRNSSGLEADHFVLKENANGIPCAFYKLPGVSTALQGENNKEYQLNAHHLSFYATMDPAHPCLSEYHYTAYFNDQDGLNYQLHVYFNSKDQTEIITFSRTRNDNYSETIVISASIQDQFEQLALDQSHQTILSLRQEHQHALETFEGSYKQLEQQLSILSRDLLDNHAAYLERLNEILKVLSVLSCIHPKYKHSASLFERIKQVFTKTPLLVLSLQDDSNEVAAETITYSEECKEEKKQVIKQSLKNGLEQAILARDHFLQAKKNSSKDLQVELFLSLDATINDALMLAEDENHFSTPLQLRQINHLMIEKIEEGSTLLAQLLLSRSESEFNLAEKLNAYTTPMQAKLLPLALKTGNARILEFVLKHGDIPVNTITVDKISPVLYCYNMHSDKSSKIECLSVLIRHNASLFVPTKSGLSVAHHLMVNKQDPLYQALIDNAETTLSRVSFFHRLCILAHHQLDTLAESHPSRSGILQAITKFGEAIQKIKNLAGGKTSSIIKELERTGQVVVQKMPEISILLEEPDVKAKVHELNILEESYIARLPSNLKLTGTQIISNINAYIKEFSPPSSQSFAECKEMLLSTINDFITLGRLKSDILDAQAELKKFYGRAKNKVKSRIKDLEEKMKPLVQKYKFMFQECDASTLKQMKFYSAIEETISNLNEVMSTTQKLYRLMNSIDFEDLISPDESKRHKALAVMNELNTGEEKLTSLGHQGKALCEKNRQMADPSISKNTAVVKELKKGEERFSTLHEEVNKLCELNKRINNLMNKKIANPAIFQNSLEFSDNSNGDSNDISEEHSNIVEKSNYCKP